MLLQRATLTPANAYLLFSQLLLAAGHLHLIPLDYRSDPSTRPKSLFDPEDTHFDHEGMAEDDDHAWLNEQDATRLLRRSLSDARDAKGEFYAANIEKDVWARISGYPESLATHFQRTRAYLPINIAKAIKNDPSLAQRAVEGFYTRDAAQLRAASRATRFPPAPPASIVLAPLTLTRTAYAQLKGQVFHPPRVFGPEWRVAPAETCNDEQVAQQEAERRYRDMGVKLTMGFEIMYREDNRKRRNTIGAGSLTSTLDDQAYTNDKEYQTYIHNLSGAGWFGQDIQGSVRYREREAEARAAWRNLIDTNG